MKTIVSPSGSDIISVRTVIEAETPIQCGSLRYEDGITDYEILSRNDKILWETQEPRRENGKQIFTSLAGETFNEDYLHFVDPENGIDKPTPVDPNVSWRHFRVDQIRWLEPERAKEVGAQEAETFSMLIPKDAHETLIRLKVGTALSQVARARVDITKESFRYREITEKEAHEFYGAAINDLIDEAGDIEF